MSTIFSARRFGKLLSKHTIDHYRNYLMSLAVLAGVMFLATSFLLYMLPGDIDRGFQLAWFVNLLIVGGTIFTSTIFNDLGEKRKSIPVLLLPASTFEKFLVGWFFSYIVFIVAYCAIFYLLLFVLVNLKNIQGNHSAMISIFGPGSHIYWLVFSLLHSIAIYGSLRFEKLQFIKTGFIFFIFFGVFIFFNTFVISRLFNKPVEPTFIFGPARFLENKQQYIVKLPRDGEDLLWANIVIVLVTLFIWIAAYFRFKEKQV